MRPYILDLKYILLQKYLYHMYATFFYKVDSIISPAFLRNSHQITTLPCWIQLSFQLCQITAHLRNSMNKGMCCFSPEDTIFLLNKWDTIEHDKRKDKFFESTKTKIRNIWKEINERHILKFSAIKVCLKYVLVLNDWKRLYFPQ